MNCASCGTQHELLDPTFRRPDAVAVIPPEKRRGNVMETDDQCAIRARNATQQDRYFVRCTLAVALVDHGDDVLMWGIWAEVSEADAQVINARWDDPDQAAQPPFAARLANDVPGYPATVGLPVRLVLTGPTTRPALSFDGEHAHSFAVECGAGVTVQRAQEWLSRMGRRRA